MPTFRCFDKHRRTDNATKFNFCCRSTFAREQTRWKTQAKQESKILTHAHPPEERAMKRELKSIPKSGSKNNAQAV